MERARLRLLIAAVLFVGWLGWLAYLAATGTHSVVLSRPQLLVADAVIVAHLTGDEDHPDETATIISVIHASGQDDTLKAGGELQINRLATCNPDHGWSGEGEYLLPLSKKGEGYAVTMVPASPGFHPGSEPFYIYPASDNVIGQAKKIIAERP
jgi:hypothetical protein